MNRPRVSRSIPAATVRLFLGTLLCSLIAKGAALQQGFGVDDYRFAFEETQGAALFWQGRIGGGALLNALQSIELDPVHAQFAWAAALITVSALFGTLLARHWRLEREGWIAFAVAALVAIHPYGCDSLHMRSALGVATVSLATVSLLLVPRRWTPRRLAAGVAIAAFAISVYQLALHYLLMVALVGTAVAWGRALAWAGVQGWSARARRALRPARVLRHPTTALFACAVGGTALYYAVARAYIAWKHIAIAERTQLLPLAQAADRARQVWRTLVGYLIGPEPWLPPVVKILLLMALTGALFGLLRRVRAPRPGRALAGALMVTAALAAALVWTLGLVLVLREFWPAPRVVAPLAIFWAGVVALAYLLNGRWLRRGLALLVGVVLLSFVGVDNRIFSEQLRRNRRDALFANRILARLETTSGFSPAARVVMVGRPELDTLPFRTNIFDTNVSALGVVWSSREIVREISGHRFAIPTAAEEAAAVVYCTSAQPFPAADSVAMRDGVAIVCLGGV